jgi:hypothetical protein
MKIALVLVDLDFELHFALDFELDFVIDRNWGHVI